MSEFRSEIHERLYGRDDLPAPKVSGEDLDRWVESNPRLDTATLRDALHIEGTNPYGEVRVTSETGGMKGDKLARFDLIPPRVLWLLAEQYGKGARKYADRNWELGTDWHLNFAAMMRHAWAFWGGEDIDPETGSPHLIAAAWHAFALIEFMETHPELDDRPKRSVDALEEQEVERHRR